MGRREQENRKRKDSAKSCQSLGTWVSKVPIKSHQTLTTLHTVKFELTNQHSVGGKNCGVLTSRRFSTSYPGSSLFLPRESTLVSAGHVAPKIWVLTRMCYRGEVAKCKIVTSVRMVESTGGDVSFFRNIAVTRTPFIDKYFFVTYERSTSKQSMLFSTQKNTFTSL